jgi:hypothetical protein
MTDVLVRADRCHDNPWEEPATRTAHGTWMRNDHDRAVVVVGIDRNIRQHIASQQWSAWRDVAGIAEKELPVGSRRS